MSTDITRILLDVYTYSSTTRENGEIKSKGQRGLANKENPSIDGQNFSPADVQYNRLVGQPKTLLIIISKKILAALL